MNPSHAPELKHASALLKQVEQLMDDQARDNEAATYHLKSGGGRIRALICLQVCQSLAIADKDAVCLATTVELLHNASLIHDDLQDQDPMRRGKKAVWKQFDSNLAICAGDLLITKAFAVLALISHVAMLPRLIHQVQSAVSATVQGQCQDLRQRSCGTLADYEQIAAAKSGPLLQLTLTLPLIVSHHPSYLDVASDALNQFAIAYQIADDLSDWQRDRDGGQLNFVNRVAEQASIEEAIEIAKTRAQYLLKSCQRQLQTLPHNCANPAVKAADNLYLKVSTNL